MKVPLAVLAAGCLLAGFPFRELFTDHHGVEEFFRESIKLGGENHVLEQMHEVGWAIKYLPTLMMMGGFGIAAWFYLGRPEIPARLARDHAILYRFLLNKWYFDEIYDFLIVRPTIRLGRLLWRGGDGWLIDGFGPDGVSARVIDVTRNVVRLQTGYLYHYAFAMLIGAALFITWFTFASGGH
jgi:NADH-quinone oxidoreductase subunit L